MASVERGAPSRAGSRVFATTTPSASAISTNDTPERLCTPSAMGAAWSIRAGPRRRGERLPQQRARGQVLGGRQRAGALGAPEVDLGLGQRHPADADEHDRDDAELQGQQLAGDRPPRPHRAAPSTQYDRYHRRGHNRDLDRHPAVSSGSRNRRRRGETLESVDGMKVLDVSTVYAAPITAMLLGDMGADVLKVEHPNGRPGPHARLEPRGARPVVEGDRPQQARGHAEPRPPGGAGAAARAGRRRGRARRELPARRHGEVGARARRAAASSTRGW